MTGQVMPERLADRSRPKKNSMYGVRNEGRAAA